MSELRGLLFDKDGTLFDFQATWGGWAADMLIDLADGDAPLADAMAVRIGLDRDQARFHADSFVIAGTLDDIVHALQPFLPGLRGNVIRSRLIESSMELAPVSAVPLSPLLGRFRSAGFVLGVATNDAEAVAVEQLRGVGVLDLFDLVVGADSGFGAKPAPGQCYEFASKMGVDAGRVAMIGDSTHDIHAGRAAGMVTVGVLTGPATHDDLEPHASVVLPDIGHLPGWLGLE